MSVGMMIADVAWSDDALTATYTMPLGFFFTEDFKDDARRKLETDIAFVREVTIDPDGRTAVVRLAYRPIQTRGPIRLIAGRSR